MAKVVVLGGGGFLGSTTSAEWLWAIQWITGWIAAADYWGAARTGIDDQRSEDRAGTNRRHLESLVSTALLDGAAGLGYTNLAAGGVPSFATKENPFLKQ